MYRITQNGEYEIDIKKSRFICQLYRVQSAEEAKEIIQAVKKEHWKATHCCSAMLIGDDWHVQRSSDDGEPSGTAGIPMLESLKQANVTDVLAITIRYFGGIKLGTGGLIRAYRSSVTEAIHHIGRVEQVTQSIFDLHLPYALVDTLQYLIKQADIPLLEQTYTSDVCFQIALNAENKEAFMEQLAPYTTQIQLNFIKDDSIERPI